MKVNKLLQRAFAIALVFISLTCMTLSAFAGETEANAPQSASLSVYFGEDGNGFADVKIDIYKAADIIDSAEYAPTDEFDKYPVELEAQTASEMRVLAQTLAAYVSRDGLQPVYSALTSQDGYAVFQGLSEGLYLVTGEQYSAEGYVYTPEPVLVNIPGYSDGQPQYDVNIVCKYDKNTDAEATVKRKVLKIWKDGGENRPEEISVQLLKNGEVADTVVLNDENGWEYTWEELDGSFLWQIVESDTPDGYTVSVSQEGITFVMTNTEKTSGTTPAPSSKDGEIPYTGVMWQPIPVLICAGLLLLLIGCVLRRGERNEK